MRALFAVLCVLLDTMWGMALDALKSRSQLLAENALLRQQVIHLRRQVGRPRLSFVERALMVFFSRFTSQWRHALHIVQPDTLLRWHRELFRLRWRLRSRTKSRRPRIHQDVVDLIRKMAKNNRTWGSERIRGELLKLGLRVSKRTIQKYIRAVRPDGGRGQTWQTFIDNHRDQIWACDFLQLYDFAFRELFVFSLFESIPVRSSIST